MYLLCVSSAVSVMAVHIMSASLLAVCLLGCSLQVFSQGDGKKMDQFKLWGFTRGSCSNNVIVVT